MGSARCSSARYEAEPLPDSPLAEAVKAERTLLAHVHAVHLSSLLRSRFAPHVLWNPRRTNLKHATNHLAANARPRLPRLGLCLEAMPLARCLACILATQLLRNPSRRSLRHRTLPPHENADPGITPFGAKLGRQAQFDAAPVEAPPLLRTTLRHLHREAGPLFARPKLEQAQEMEEAQEAKAVLGYARTEPRLLGRMTEQNLPPAHRSHQRPRLDGASLHSRNKSPQRPLMCHLVRLPRTRVDTKSAHSARSKQQTVPGQVPRL